MTLADAEVARDVELRERERPDGDAARRERRAPRRQEGDVDVESRLRGVREHQVRPERGVLPDADDRARGRPDEVARGERRDALPERPSPARRRGLPLDDEAGRLRLHEDRAPVGRQAEERGESVAPGSRLARRERHGNLGPAAPVARVPEEPDRRRRRCRPGVPEREVGRPEGPRPLDPCARREEPAVRHRRARAGEGPHLREVEAVGRELAGVDRGEPARVIHVVAPDDLVEVGNAVRRPDLRWERRRRPVLEERRVLVDEADPERRVRARDLGHGLPRPLDEPVLLEGDVGGVGDRAVPLVVGHVARHDDDRVGPARGAAPEEEDQLLQLLAVLLVVVVPEVVPRAGGEGEVVAERLSLELAAPLVDPGRDRGPRDRRGRLGLRRRVGPRVGVVPAVRPRPRADEPDRQVRRAQGEPVAEGHHPAVLLVVVPELPAAAVVEGARAGERGRDVAVVLLDALARHVDPERLHRCGLLRGRWGSAALPAVARTSSATKRSEEIFIGCPPSRLSRAAELHRASREALSSESSSLKIGPREAAVKPGRAPSWRRAPAGRRGGGSPV